MSSTDAVAAPPRYRLIGQLWFQVLVATLAGILLGHFDPGLAEKTKPLRPLLVGDGFGVVWIFQPVLALAAVAPNVTAQASAAVAAMNRRAMSIPPCCVTAPLRPDRLDRQL